ncbi:MAG: putative toxin-antitoxin system toxin component, PIN family [Bacteroidota bacterium]|nr:putative toxin-antitoxin system toxin component, PIN family [Bacteroidota bacterium]MDP4230475.1 putative toxin-antitoxin system toxin component, PIN family [Bacteroidota bacterium]MDP4236453.1 putative toxin-antitoxin system toxin component, PIN family [Bacteroidota bacterium]
MPDRIIFDTNVLVSALLMKHSTPRKAFSAALRNSILLASEETLTELEEVLRRQKLDKYSRLEDRIYFFRAFIDLVEVVPITSVIRSCPDPRDNKFLELAADGEARFIISGDKDLLKMHPFNGIQILSPTLYLREISDIS